MNASFRPIHCGFETLRLASDPARTTQGYSRLGFATNEQMIARGTGHLRPHDAALRNLRGFPGILR